MEKPAPVAYTSPARMCRSRGEDRAGASSAAPLLHPGAAATSRRPRPARSHRARRHARALAGAAAASRLTRDPPGATAHAASPLARAPRPEPPQHAASPSLARPARSRRAHRARRLERAGNHRISRGAR
nr:uncharacterized protein LOC127334892 [Lolium perenne]